MPPTDPPATVLPPEDAAVLSAVARGGVWTRALLHTLARRGCAFRRAHPERARAVLAALEPSPFYKGGQFLFDLLEWEDFILDGPPPPLLPTALDAQALARIAAFLRAVQHTLDGGVAPETPATGPMDASLQRPRDEDLPPLEPGFFLYRDVVLGVVASAGPLLVTPGS